MNSEPTDIAKMAALLAEDQSVENEIIDEINDSQLVSTLISLRVGKGVSQETIADRMSCSPSKISRMESGTDRTLKWSDMTGYVNALGINTTLAFHDSELPAAERIKHSVFQIAEDLESLAKLAKDAGGQDEIAQKIQQFYGEVLFNFLRKYQDNYSVLPNFTECRSKSSDGNQKGESVVKRLNLVQT